MDNKIKKILIKVGILMTAYYEPYLFFNAKNAKETGVENQDLKEAIIKSKLVKSNLY